MNDSERIEASAQVSDKGTRVRRVDIDVIAYPMRHVGKSGYESTDVPGAITNRTRMAIRIETADGSVGEFVGSNESMIAQTKTCARMLLGYDAFARELFYEDAKRKLRKNDRMGVEPIDIALWDLAGKRSNVSVSQMLGGFRTRLKAYASTWFGGKTGGLASPEAFDAF